MPFIPTTEIVASPGWVKLSEVTPGGSGDLDLTSISSSYLHLRLMALLRSNRAAVTNDNIGMEVNGDTGNNYDYQFEQMYGVQVGNAGEGISASSFALIATAPAASSPAGAASTVTIDIPFYSATTFRKTVWSQCSGGLYDSTEGQRLWWLSGEWRNTAAINRIRLFSTSANQFSAGSRAVLYGIA